jgi:hypothetical protein
MIADRLNATLFSETHVLLAAARRFFACGTHLSLSAALISLATQRNEGCRLSQMADRDRHVEGRMRAAAPVSCACVQTSPEV